MKQTARKRHKHKNMSKKRHVKKRNTRKLYMTKASGKNVKLEWYNKILQKWTRKLAYTKLELEGAKRRVADLIQSEDFRARQKILSQLLTEREKRFTHAINVITQLIRQEEENAATRIQSVARSKTAKTNVKIFRAEFRADIEFKKLLAAIKASEKAVANATTSAAAAASATTSAVITSKLPSLKTPKTPKSKIEQMEVQVEVIFDIIRTTMKKNKMKPIPADGSRLAVTGKQVLYKTLLTYIMQHIGKSDKDDHIQARDYFGSRLELKPDNEFTEQSLGFDTVTYIRFNINILCPESQLQLPTVPGSGQPYWDAHITLVNDAAMKNNVYKLSHLTFTQYNINGAKINNLHVYQDNADLNLVPFPSAISQSRLTTFRDLVFSFVQTHPVQLKEMEQSTYLIAYRIESDAESRHLGIPPSSSRLRCTGQQYKGHSAKNQQLSTRSNVTKNAGRRKFTLKISSHRTRYNKRKHKTINSTQKNKRRK